MTNRKIMLGVCVVMFILSNFVYAQENKKDKRSTFVQTVDALIEQVDMQSQDRDKLLKNLKNLSKQLKITQTANLDNRIIIARDSTVEREALLTSEKLVDSPRKAVVKTNLIEFLRRVIEKDQQLYDDYLEQRAQIQFQLEKQIAKIRAEQTQLSTIRRDLEKIKFYPLKKERAQFFLSSISQVLDGLGK